ncbi:MAG: SRPBCC family protein [Mucilaginibacter sp.]
MKILKKILIVLAIIIAVLLIAALFIKKDYAIQREIVINRPKQEVYDYVKYLKNQDNYSKWAKLDPNMKKEYKGTDATVGFVSAWSGNSDVGVGEQEIKAMAPGERIDYELHFMKPMEAVSPAFMSFEDASPAQTKVKWGMSGESTYPMNIMNPFMDGMLGGDLEIGLSNLKSLLEKQ